MYVCEYILYYIYRMVWEVLSLLYMHDFVMRSYAAGQPSRFNQQLVCPFFSFRNLSAETPTFVCSTLDNME